MESTMKLWLDSRDSMDKVNTVFALMKVFAVSRKEAEKAYDEWFGGPEVIIEEDE